MNFPDINRTWTKFTAKTGSHKQSNIHGNPCLSPGPRELYGLRLLEQKRIDKNCGR